MCLCDFLPNFSKCCCCIPLRIGSIIICVFIIIAAASSFYTSTTSLRCDKRETTMQKVLYYTTYPFLVLSILIFFTWIALLVAVVQENANLITTFLYIVFIAYIFEVVYVIVHICTSPKECAFSIEERVMLPILYLIALYFLLVIKSYKAEILG